MFRRSRQKPKVPLLLFDFDGTLADTLEKGVAIYNRIADEYQLKPLEKEELAELRRLNTRAVLDRLGISRVMAVKLAARMRKLLSKEIADVDLLPGIGEALRRLKDEGFVMGVLSSNSLRNIRKCLKQQGVSDCFTMIEAGASLFGKAERLRRIMKKEGIEAREILYVGDETRDMEAARHVGVHACAACWGVNEPDTMRAEDPEFVLSDAAELFDVAQGLKQRLSKA